MRNILSLRMVQHCGMYFTEFSYYKFREESASTLPGLLKYLPDLCFYGMADMNNF